MNLRLIFSVVFGIASCCLHAQGLEVTIEKAEAAPMPIVMGRVKPHAEKLKSLAAILKKDLEFTNQFTIELEDVDLPTHKNDIAVYLQRQRPLIIYLISISGDSVEWRLYDATTEKMIDGKLVDRNGRSISVWAHAIADSLWPLLTTQSGSFSSVIAACKRVKTRKNKKASNVYICSPFLGVDGSEKLVLGDSRFYFAPRWHSQRPQLFYSVHTPTNISLATISPGHESRIVTDFDGQNMTPAISKLGRIVLSLSCGDDAYLYEYIHDDVAKKSSFKQLTFGKGQYISPSFKNENELFFCYVDQRGLPCIGLLDLATKKTSWITSGYGVCPCVSPDESMVAYCSKAGGVLQVFVYHCGTKKHEQITKDTHGHKDEVSWSPCGNFLVFSVEKGSSSRIACLHLPSKTVRFITPVHEYWSFPSWAPRYVGVPYL